MILVDTSVWIDHLRRGDPTLSALLEKSQVLAHPFIVGEIALGRLKQRTTVLASLSDLPQANVAKDEEVLSFVERNQLFEFGIGFVDAHLLAATQLTPDARLWTRDKRLATAATWLGIAANPNA